MAYRIRLKEASFAYEGCDPVIEGFGFAVEPGEVVAIAGGAGRGKTTLLKICAGLLEPSGGELSIDGLNFWGLAETGKNDIRRRMGFDFQEGALIANMTISQNLSLPLLYHGEMSDRDVGLAVDRWIERMDLGGCRSQLPAALSSNLRRRVSFIRAVLCGRDAFFWDDPGQVADDMYQEFVAKVIRERKRDGVLSVVATGDRGYLGGIVDRIVDI